MKIGIPRSLVYYYYYPFWKTLFNSLGHELVISSPTTTAIVNKGVKEATPEICVPIKVFIGQVLDLLEKNVDKIYIPRFVSIKKGITFCPKFLGLPDMIIHSLKGLENKVLTHHIETRDDDISEYNNYKGLLGELRVSSRTMKKALTKARQNWLEFRRMQKEGYDTQALLEGEKEKQGEGKITIGLLGYVYNIYDQFINMGIINRLKELGIKFITFEMLDEKILEKELKAFDKLMFWEFTNKILGAGYHLIHSPEIAGVIHVTAFGCGPDSILGPFLEFEADKRNKPFMTLRIDEQTGKSHLLTRVEAFTDLLKLKIAQKDKKENAG